jgi:hypothetical protein
MREENCAEKWNENAFRHAEDVKQTRSAGKMSKYATDELPLAKPAGLAGRLYLLKNQH